MPDVEIHDPAFARFALHNAPLKRLATGFDWAEGPVWFGDAGCLLFSDIPNDRILRWTPGQPEGLTTFRQPASHANGHARDREGRLVSCEHGTRRVTRTELDGRITVLCDGFEGRRLNSPNDVVVAADGAVWFTDPHYGIASDHEGLRAEQELPCRVYRVDPSGEARAMIEDMACPNGLCFSPDESRLYVADTGRVGEADPQHVRAFAWDGARLTGGEVFCNVSPGATDGLRCDAEGHVWSSAGDGVHCLHPDGHLMGKVLVPETVSNLCWGGTAARPWARHVLYVTATTSLYAVALNRLGAQRP